MAWWKGIVHRLYFAIIVLTIIHEKGQEKEVSDFQQYVVLTENFLWKNGNSTKGICGFLKAKGVRGFPYASQFSQSFRKEKSVKILPVDVHRQCLLLCPVSWHRQCLLFQYWNTSGFISARHFAFADCPKTNMGVTAHTDKKFLKKFL